MKQMPNIRGWWQGQLFQDDRKSSEALKVDSRINIDPYYLLQYWTVMRLVSPWLVYFYISTYSTVVSAQTSFLIRVRTLLIYQPHSADRFWYSFLSWCSCSVISVDFTTTLTRTVAGTQQCAHRRSSSYIYVIVGVYWEYEEYLVLNCECSQY